MSHSIWQKRSHTKQHQVLNLKHKESSKNIFQYIHPDTTVRSFPDVCIGRCFSSGSARHGPGGEMPGHRTSQAVRASSTREREKERVYMYTSNLIPWRATTGYMICWFRKIWSTINVNHIIRSSQIIRARGTSLWTRNLFKSVFHWRISLVGQLWMTGNKALW